MNPNAWGPLGWHLIHQVAYYPDDAKYSKLSKHFTTFYESLKAVLPCPICRVHYSEHIEDADFKAITADRDSLTKWTWELHNTVNEMLDKPTITLKKADTLYFPDVEPIHSKIFKFIDIAVHGANFVSADEVRYYADFFQALSYVFPCEECAVGLRRVLKEHPLEVEKIRKPAQLVAWYEKWRLGWQVPHMYGGVRQIVAYRLFNTANGEYISRNFYLQPADTPDTKFIQIVYRDKGEGEFRVRDIMIETEGGAELAIQRNVDPAWELRDARIYTPTELAMLLNKK